MGSPLELNDAWLDRIRRSVEGLEYGQVQIIVHDGRIVQIERTERRRFGNEHPTAGTEAPSRPSKASGVQSSD
ncbi:YezD family protein [Gorillibacterium sp. sgz5001074]|uniref:YezD family protein n=1 Tax=Gorillibacterium sp. sgz5001074 TaxID=3446695 RepID=UPI003F6738E8